MSRLIIVSNRLPVAFKTEEGQLNTYPGSGGLVTAIAPVLRDRGGLWIGWSGLDDTYEKEVDTKLSDMEETAGFALQQVPLTQEDIKLYYEGFANEVIWPLFHDFQLICNFDPRYWVAAQEVNRKFAEVTFEQAQEGDFVWIHDYHLMMVGKELRNRGIPTKIGFFLHIPFPSPDIFIKLPWRFQVLRSLLEYDLIGFQTAVDLRNFTQCVRKLLPEVRLKDKNHIHTGTVDGREVRLRAFPISIDFNEFSKAAAKRDVAEEAWLSHEKMAGQKIIFSVDRLDRTKGIPYRLQAIRMLLKNHPELHQKITFVQVVLPSRVEIPVYQNLKKEIDGLVGEINSEFTKSSWVPIHYLFRSLSKKELLTFYRMSEVALVTPIRDGMNLVCKEYVASNVDEKGVLVLSEFAGAAAQLQHEALLVNPYDIVGLSETLLQALTLSDSEKKRRMRKMRSQLRRSDIFSWVRAFLNTAIEKELHDFPLIKEYVPIG